MTFSYWHNEIQYLSEKEKNDFCPICKKVVYWRKIDEIRICTKCGLKVGVKNT